jgi:hypothetical protein
MLKQAYLTLADPLLGDKERLKIGTIVSFFRGTYDLLQFVEAENACRGMALDRIDEIADLMEKRELDAEEAAFQIRQWVNDARNWRKAKVFGVSVGDLTEFDESWTEEISKTRHPDTL